MPDVEMLLTYIPLVAVFIVLFWVGWLEYRMQKLFKGKQGADLEDIVTSLLKNQQEVTTFRSTLEEYLRTVERRIKRSIQSVETIRFNPFKGDGSGGNQSFSTAFLDEEGNGVVISSLFARERAHTYSKPVQRFDSSFELTGEEKTAIENARSKIKEKSA